jgi:SAM-dependent MidA family methyltransferase
MPTLIIGNEFFDALPIQQYRKQINGWSPIVVTAEDDCLALCRWRKWRGSVF